ncbi:MAG: type II toxin-antitoxin system RelE/ParE family toxin [Methylacidiphilales bacterium]|nr:type II toxin-antitoxin system RelE/ParE family toxin [Candidatus Methylacidiphilales bacterium]
MPRRIILSPEAKADAQDAYNWYEEQDRGLGDEFLRCLESAFDKIAKNPQQYPVRFDDFRRILLRRFPYAVYFEYDDISVYIYYVFHCSQNPAKLSKRLRGS